ncbi:hypothetical protein HXV84_20150 [Pseudomonas amygdali pv. morsprunorum]|nr:hypothetical protein [Pseudomonas amygdali pv. morsprunorum]
MNSDQLNQHDAERLHQRVAAELGITAEELTTWMINDIERVTEGGEDVGHMVVFRESTLRRFSTRFSTSKAISRL